MADSVSQPVPDRPPAIMENDGTRSVGSVADGGIYGQTF